MHRPILTTSKLLIAGLACAALAGVGACRGDRTDKPPRQFLPDMDDSPKFKPQTATEFFVDGRSMRRTVPGVVPFGQSVDPADPDRARYLKADPQFFEGRVSDKPDAEYVKFMPSSITVDEAFIRRGQERFNIYCSVCHGFDGRGQGMVGKRWSYGLPNFMDKIYTERETEPKARDGYIFHTIRNGVPNEGKPDDPWKMPPYAHAVTERDAWAIVSYLRVLQAVGTGSLSDVSESQREALIKSKPVPVAPAPSTPASSTPAPGAKP